MVEVKIELSDADRLARLLTQLKDADYEKREAAVRLLARHPETALPALRAARVSAAPENQWWIDAAIQEAEGSGRGVSP